MWRSGTEKVFWSVRVHEYLAAYAMEKSLSLDNMFVFLLIFRSLDIPDENQHTALAWGIFGALLFRALFIVLGVSALERWDASATYLAVSCCWQRCTPYEVIRRDAKANWSSGYRIGFPFHPRQVRIGSWKSLMVAAK